MLFWRWPDQTTAVESPSRGVREAILGEELHIPEDVALIGVGHTQVTSLTGMDLTAILQNTHQMGITDTVTLTNNIEGSPYEDGKPGDYGRTHHHDSPICSRTQENGSTDGDFLILDRTHTVDGSVRPGRVTAVFVQALETVKDLGGGTRIGHCLRCFNENYGTRLLSSKTIFMIFSDGYDRGEIDLLEQEMAYLKRRVCRTIWLNPLLGLEDYKPICRGMSAALPFVDHFLPLGDLHDLQLLEKSLEEMITIGFRR